MSIPPAFTYYDGIYRTGGVFEPTHRFSLVNRTIQVNKNKNFKVRFPNIWYKYKLPKVRKPEIYDNWLANQMMFWQNQLNFAVWCATTGCGVSKNDHLRSENPMIRSFFKFHVYYQIRRILREMECALPTSEYWDAFDNKYDASVFEKICNEFNISTKTNFRQKLDYSNGMGSFYYHKHFYKNKFILSGGKLTDGGNYDPSMNWEVPLNWNKSFGANVKVDKIEYIEQNFRKQSDTTDASSDGDPMQAIGSFVLDDSYGFTHAGTERINESIKTYVWAILGAQAQAESSILGGGEAFTAQKNFGENVEAAINSDPHVPNLRDRYQSTIQYAGIKLDFVLGVGLNIIPRDMDLHIDTINGYNNSIKVANKDMKNLQLGQNNNINDESIIIQETFEIPPDDFDDPAIIQPPDDEPSIIQPKISQDTQLTHDETKLAITLSGIIGGTFLIWYLKA